MWSIRLALAIAFGTAAVLLAVDESPEADVHWEGMLIDLAGAHLVDFDFARCRAGHADFRNARFTGIAGFSGAAFDGITRFDGAQFAQATGFSRARSSEQVGFGGAVFGGDARRPPSRGART